MKLGSLFDGSGVFPFAAQQSGIEPVWASEIEPFPIAVTRKRFPNMKHLGDVSRINGAELKPVDIITFGSPCQDLSVAGKRAGLDGERSGLFMQAIRIIKEMRKKTNGQYPTFAVWENVPGAFSSAGGEDFRAVLQAFVSIADETANVPRPSGGKWSTAGEIVGNGYSVAWRVLDAQFWGVPQRRRRIFLVADFRNQRAGRILFERNGLQRDFAESREAWQGITKSLAFRATAEKRTATAAGFLPNAGAKARSIGYEDDLSPCLRATVTPCIVAYALQANGIDRADTAGCNGRGWSKDVSYTLNTVDRHAVCAFACNQRDEVRLLGDKAGAIQAQPGMKQQTFLACYDARGNGNGLIAPTITGDHENRITDYTAVVCALDRSAYNQGQNAQYDMGIDENGKAFTVIAKGPGAVCYPINTMVATRGGADDGRTTFGVGENGEAQFTISAAHSHAVCYDVHCKIILRRLTPTECARLQGMPDWWVDGIENPNPTEDDMRFWREVFETHRRIVTGASKPKTDKQIRKWLANPHSDSVEYKMWGNGVALPCVMYVMEGIAREMEEI